MALVNQLTTRLAQRRVLALHALTPLQLLVGLLPIGKETHDQGYTQQGVDFVGGGLR